MAMGLVGDNSGRARMAFGLPLGVGIFPDRKEKLMNCAKFDEYSYHANFAERVDLCAAVGFVRWQNGQNPHRPGEIQKGCPL